MKHLSTRLLLLCGMITSYSILWAQPTPEEIRAKEIDTKITDLNAAKPTDSIIINADDPLIKDILSISTSVKAYWYDGSLQKMVTRSIDASGNKWEVRYYFSDTALYFLKSDFYTVQTFISPEFFVWQFQKSFYIRNGSMFYYAADGTDRGMPPDYEDLNLMWSNAKKYYAIVREAKAK